MIFKKIFLNIYIIGLSLVFGAISSYYIVNYNISKISVSKKFSLGYVYSNNICPQSDYVKYLQILDDSIISSIISKYGVKVVSDAVNFNNNNIYTKDSRHNITYVPNQNNSSIRVIEVVYTSSRDKLESILASFDEILNEINQISSKVYYSNYSNVNVICGSKLYKFYSYVPPGFINFEPFIYSKYGSTKIMSLFFLPFLCFYILFVMLYYAHLNKEYLQKVIRIS